MSALSELSTRIIESSSRLRQLAAMVSDGLMMPLALWTAMALRLGELTPDVVQFWPAFAVAALISIPTFSQLGLYRQVVRYMGNHAMWAVAKGATITAVAISVVAYMVPLKGFPRSVPIIFWLISLARLLLAIPWLKRLDAAAAYEEQSANAED